MTLWATGVWAAEVPQQRQEQWARAMWAGCTAPYERNTRALLEGGLSVLRRVAEGQGVRLRAVQGQGVDRGWAYFDVPRVHEAWLLEETLRGVEEVRQAWLEGKVTHPVVLEAVGSWVRGVRQAAEAPLEDARVTLGWVKASQRLPRPRWVHPWEWLQAQEALREAEEAWVRAQAPLQEGDVRTAGPLLLATWRRAREALALVGVHFRPGSLSDRDRDGVPDQLEVRMGASPLSRDTDGDGLSDLYEMRFGGVHLVAGLADTDGDGVGDGEEDTDRDGDTNRQEQSRWSDPLRRPEPPTVATAMVLASACATPPPKDRAPHCSAPPRKEPVEASVTAAEAWEVKDTDGDGLEDSVERLYETPVDSKDGDGDGLDDATELALCTDPGLADTDADGFTDGEEIAQRDKGFDPLVEDEHLTPGEWGRYYSDGLLMGDTCDTLFSGWKPCVGKVPFFLGQLSGGAASFIPVVGWVLGTLGDIRDTLGNLAKGEWVGAGLSAVGLLPYVGDAASLAGKVVAFVRRFGKLEEVLRAVLVRLPQVLAVGPRGKWLPPGTGAAMGETARGLVLEVLRKLNPEGFADLQRQGGEEFLTRLAAMGTRWADMALLFNRLEDSGLFSQYPHMREFIEKMIRETPDEVLVGGGDILSLHGRVTLNLKKAALRLRHGSPKYLETVRNHLRAALAEHSTLAKLPADEEIIRLGHVTANGVDRVCRVGNIIHVLEVKAASKLGFHDISNWIKATVDPKTGNITYLFNGNRLAEYLRRAGYRNLQELFAGREVHFNLFVYDANPRLAEDLFALFKSGKTRLRIQEFGDMEITLTLTKHWN